MAVNHMRTGTINHVKKGTNEEIIYQYYFEPYLNYDSDIEKEVVKFVKIDDSENAIYFFFQTEPYIDGQKYYQPPENYVLKNLDDFIISNNKFINNGRFTFTVNGIFRGELVDIEQGDYEKIQLYPIEKLVISKVDFEPFDKESYEKLISEGFIEEEEWGLEYDFDLSNILPVLTLGRS